MDSKKQSGIDRRDCTRVTHLVRANVGETRRNETAVHYNKKSKITTQECSTRNKDVWKAGNLKTNWQMKGRDWTVYCTHLRPGVKSLLRPDLCHCTGLWDSECTDLSRVQDTAVNHNIRCNNTIDVIYSPESSGEDGRCAGGGVSSTQVVLLNTSLARAWKTFWL